MGIGEQFEFEKTGRIDPEPGKPSMKRSDITDRMVCEAARKCYESQLDEFGNVSFITTILIDQTGAPLKVVEAALKRAIRRGLIEVGVSERTGWLSATGIRLLAVPETKEERIERYNAQVRAVIQKHLEAMAEEFREFWQTTHGSSFRQKCDLHFVCVALEKCGREPGEYQVSELCQRIRGFVKLIESEANEREDGNELSKRS